MSTPHVLSVTRRHGNEIDAEDMIVQQDEDNPRYVILTFESGDEIIVDRVELVANAAS